jgi:hypothetical protein
MRIIVRGWGRDQGEKEIMNTGLGEAETGDIKSYSRGNTYLQFEYEHIPHLHRARVTTSAELRLGGRYLLQVELRRREIDQLFYAMHGGEIVRQFQSFVANEERERQARKRERFKEIEEHMRAERAAAELIEEEEPETK